jgi:TfoX/Sxy family transcriptional regulator of competence genes
VFDFSTMPYNTQLADRIRVLLAAQTGVVEKNMFGGIAFLLNGNLCVGVLKEEMIARMSHEAAEAALSRPGTRPFQVSTRSKPMAGWLYVSVDVLKTAATLRKWVDECVTFAAALPPK